MDIEIKLDSAYTTPKLVVYAAEMTDEVAQLLRRLGEGAPHTNGSFPREAQSSPGAGSGVRAASHPRQQAAPHTLAGFQGEVATLLPLPDIVRVYAEKQKVYAQTEAGAYQVRLRLYEAEALLDAAYFVRISNSEIINLRRVENMDLSFTGTICVRLQNGQAAYVSRRYVPKIKALLGL